ncbi:MAG: glutamate racemase [Dysgonamonadaceae bacterium]|jgi:glutamate racemase|nr:glutamate racemase [Dysgonamonadaceae bacterium]
MQQGAIGLFDSGYGGLTILEEIRRLLPQYDYVYLGDNARTPYGTRSYEVVYEFTLQAVKRLFAEGCPLIILACNTASAKALRTIQQNDLPKMDSRRRVLGIIRPTVESVAGLTRTNHVGVFGTQGTIQSESYPLEIHKLFPEIVVTGEACPMWVPLVENGEYDSPGADFFIRKNVDSILKKDSLIDTLILGCTHYPLLENKIRQYLPEKIKIVSQGKYVAAGLADYLKRHPEMDELCTKKASVRFYTTESERKFADMASVFLKNEIRVKRLSLE